jgi:hypothetical protein
MQVPGQDTTLQPVKETHNLAVVKKNSSHISEEHIRISVTLHTYSSENVWRVVQRLDLLLRNREIPDSKLGSDTDYIDRSLVIYLSICILMPKNYIAQMT